jgi:hypothetical protein
MANWLNILMDEDPVGNPTVDLPTENEKEGEHEEAGHEASGALSEDDDPKGMKTVPFGEDEITGEKSTGYDDAWSIFDKDDEDADEDEDDKEDGKKDDKGSDDDDASKSAPLEGEEDDDDKKLKDFLAVLDEDDPGNPTIDLPSENEKEGEKEAAGHEASGALSEDDDPKGMKNVPAGEDEISGEKSTEFDDVWSIFDKDDEEKDKKDDEADDGDKEDKDDDKDTDKKEEEKPSDDEEPVKDFSDFFVDEGVEEPDGLPSGSTAKPAEPVDGNGHDVDPIGDPDLPSNLTEPVLVPVASPEGGKEGELKNALNMLDEDNSRYFFGDFSF